MNGITIIIMRGITAGITTIGIIVIMRKDTNVKKRNIIEDVGEDVVFVICSGKKKRLGGR